MSVWDTVTDTTRDAAESGMLGDYVQAGETFYSAGEAIPDEAHDDLRDAASDEGSPTEQVAVETILGTEETVDAAEETGDQVTDATDPSNWLPWWAPYALAAVILLWILVALQPYAQLGAEVA
jgi:hypothetical protein